MATTTIRADEWAGAPLRPVARWVPELGPDDRIRLVMVWSVPEPAVPTGVSAAA